MMTIKNILISSVLCGIILSVSMHGSDSLENLSFRVKAMDPSDEEEIKDAIEQYNAISARFYNMGGTLSGLDSIPASQLVKRRLFKDITLLKGDGLVMVFDRDTVNISDVNLVRKEAAEVHTEEVWAVALQYADTRRPVFNIKMIQIKARYLLYKGFLQDETERWIVSQVDVYPHDETVPLRSLEQVL